jgi:hypothetical protein
MLHGKHQLLKEEDELPDAFRMRLVCEGVESEMRRMQ